MATGGEGVQVEIRGGGGVGIKGVEAWETERGMCKSGLECHGRDPRSLHGFYSCIGSGQWAATRRAVRVCLVCTPSLKRQCRT